MSFPGDVATDSSGNLYIADSSNYRVRKVAAGTGIITTIAGNEGAGFSGDGGLATNAMLGVFGGIAVDSAANVYIADTSSYRVRKVTASTGIISTIAGNGSSDDSGDGGLAVNAGLLNPSAVATDSGGNVYISDGNRIRKIAASTSIITTFAGAGIPPGGYSGGGGLAIDATFAGSWFPIGGSLAVDASGDLLFADSSDGLVLEIDSATNIINAVAGGPSHGSGPTYGLLTLGTIASGLGFAGTRPVDLDPGAPYGSGVSNAFYIGDAGHAIVLAATFNDTRFGFLYNIATVAGDGTATFSGDGVLALDAGIGLSQIKSNPVPQLPAVLPVAGDPAGNIYIIDSSSGTETTRVRQVAAATGIISTIAGGGSLAGTSADGGSATSANLDGAQALAVKGTVLYITDGNGNLRKVDLTTGIITTVTRKTNAGSGLALDAAGNLYFTSGDSIEEANATTGAVTVIAGTYQNCSGTCDPAMFGAYTGAQLGDGGPATNAILNAPQGVGVDTIGNIYIADTNDHRIRLVTAATGIISTIAGTNAAGCSSGGGNASAALLSIPTTIATDPAGHAYVADPVCGEVFELVLAPPQAPTLVSPTNSADLTSVSGQMLVWDAAAGASSYDVYLGAAPLPPQVVANVTGTTYALPTLSLGTSYNWRIVAKNNGGSTSSDEYDFSTPIAQTGCVSLSPLAMTYRPTGGSGSISVTVGAGCLSWSAVSNASWITVSPSTASGSGSGTVNYAVGANSAGFRVGSIGVGGVIFSVIEGTSNVFNGIGNPGVFRNGQWWLDESDNPQWIQPPDLFFVYGQAGDVPVIGDWTNSLSNRIGVFRQGQWWLDIDGDRQWTEGTDEVFTYGQPGDIPVVGDWTNNGVQRIGIFRNGQWWLDINNDHQWTQSADTVFTYGQPGDTPIVGDWDNAGIQRLRSPAHWRFATANGGSISITTINGRNPPTSYSPSDNLATSRCRGNNIETVRPCRQKHARHCL